MTKIQSVGFARGLNTGYKNSYLWKFFYTRFQVYKRAKDINEQN
jgi:hypothetical protein